MMEASLQTCVNCGKLSAFETKRDERFGRGERAVLIEDVQLMECRDCGIVYLAPETSRMIDEICAHPERQRGDR